MTSLINRAAGLGAALLAVALPAARGEGETPKETWLARADAVLSDATPAAERQKAAEEICSSFNIRYGVWHPYFLKRYTQYDKWPDDAELDRMEKAFWAGAEFLAREQGKTSCKPWMTLGEAYLYKERHSEALKAYDKALEFFKDWKPGSRGGSDLAWCLYLRANALFGLGRKEEAKAALEDFLSRQGLPSFTGRHDERIVNNSRIAVHNMEGGDLDRMRMPRFTGAHAFPEPQQHEYSDSFVPVTAYALEVKGLEPGDRRLELLDVKFTRFGAPKKAGAAFKVSVVVDPKTKAFDDLRNGTAFAAFRAKKFRPSPDLGKEPVDISPKAFCDYMENEAYVLEVTKGGATIVAKTAQGALWGIVSLVQLWDQENHRIRLAKIRDWPDVERRGFLGGYWEGAIEYCLFNKINSVCLQRHPCNENRFRPVNWYLEEFMGRQFHDFGLEFFCSYNSMTHCPQLPMCSPRTLPYRISICRRYAAAHIGVYYPLDDVRYPICESDQKAYGNQISKVDGEHQNAIFQAVIREYPDWRFIICPPPYWGPDGNCPYPEGRDHYLETWSKELDPRIETYWTGPRVKSWKFKPYHGEWVLKKYGRRPYLFQNGIYWHNLMHYTVDEMDWRMFYCEGMLDKVLKGYHLNCQTPTDLPRIASLANALWDLGRHDERWASDIGLAQVSGERMFGLLRPALRDLSYFDKYEYGKTDERVDLEDVAEMERRALNIETCWSNATAYAKEIGAPIYGSFGKGVGFQRNVMQRLRNPPDLSKAYQKQLKEISDIAFRETSFSREKGHTYVSPLAFSGGVNEPVKRAARRGSKTKKAAPDQGMLYRTLKREGTGRSSASFTFTCETFPAGCDYKLHLSATTAGKSANIRLSVNGKKFFEGDPKTGKDPLKPVMKTFVIPEKLLKRANTVTIENLIPGTGAFSSEDCYRIRYAVVRAADDAMDDI